MANTTYETSTWESYGKWTLVALILVLFLACLFAAVWGWEQGYFDTVVPTRPKSSRFSSTPAAPSINFSSYRSTLNAQMRGGATPPAYTPNHLNHGPTPEPTYRTHTAIDERLAHGVCPLPSGSSPDIYSNQLNEGIGLDDLAPPEPMATNPWETVGDNNTGTGSRASLQSITNQTASRVSTKNGSVGAGRPTTSRPTSGAPTVSSRYSKAPATTSAPSSMRSLRFNGPNSARFNRSSRISESATPVAASAPLSVKSSNASSSKSTLNNVNPKDIV